MSERVVLITGASSGLGFECSKYLATRGYRVFGAARRFPDETQPFETVHMDVCDDDSVSRAIEQVLARTERIDALVNMAGVCRAGAIELHSTYEARTLFETNTLGTFRVCRAVLPAMRAQRQGQIVNVSSLAGVIALPYCGIYSASKFAVEGLTESLRLEVRGHGIRVSLLEPGDFLTAQTEKYTWTQASQTDSIYRKQAERAVRIMEADSRSNTDLEQVAKRLEQILMSPRPLLRYSVGKAIQRAAVPARRLLPDELFEGIVRTVYRIW